jgi:hypothetical protein
VSSGIPAQKRALVSLLRDLFPDAGVSYGPPTKTVNDMAYCGGVQVDNSTPTAGGPRRSREEVAAHQVILSKYVPGTSADNDSQPVEDDAQQAATEGAYEMLDVLEDHFRVHLTAPLDGTAYTAIVSGHELTEYKITNTSGAVTGRVGEITATVTTKYRPA